MKLNTKYDMYNSMDKSTHSLRKLKRQVEIIKSLRWKRRHPKLQIKEIESRMSFDGKFQGIIATDYQDATVHLNQQQGLVTKKVKRKLTCLVSELETKQFHE